MIPFSLSMSSNKLFPHEVDTATGKVDVDPDYRTVLKCMRVLQDPDATESHKMFLLMRWFFKSQYVPDAMEVFMKFVSCGDDSSDDEPVMDFEQDADAIYSSFWAQYNIDLADIPFLHWRKFMVLLSGLGEHTEIRERIAIRELDTSKMKGDDKIKADKAKRRVALKVRLSTEEKMLQQKLDEALANGVDPTDALSALQAYYKGGE